MKRNRLCAALLAAAMILGNFPLLFAQSNTVTVSSKKDFLKLAENCRLDSWSVGKTVNLTCDIDFKGEKFSPIPTFGGTFNGNGYTISGIKLSRSGSDMGVFRFIQEGGTVENLNIKGKFSPGGTKSEVGGIAGENNGIIKDCTFSGTVKGENALGGIAGKNGENGQIISCAVSGSVIGQNSTGGIAGENKGFISGCVNRAEINTEYEEKKQNITDINTDAGAIVETYKNNREENEEESVLGHTDTGGITGYSSGIVQGCENRGDVGYPHVGYNIGGIAGRQSGYILSCSNHGLIQGRKDVGGIVGQAEPYILLDTSGNVLTEVRAELNKLNNMIDNFITDTDNLGDKAQRHLDDMSSFSESALDNTEIMMNRGSDFIDDNIAEINAQTALLLSYTDRLSPALEGLETGMKRMSTGMTNMYDAIGDISIYIPDFTEEPRKILDSISAENKKIKTSSDAMKTAAKKLKDAVRNNDKEQIAALTAELKRESELIEASAAKIKDEAARMPLAMESVYKAIDDFADETVKDLRDAKTDLRRAMSSFSYGADDISDSVGDIREIISDMSKEEPIEFVKLGDEFKTASDGLFDSLSGISDSMDALSDTVGNGADDISGNLRKISNQLNLVMNLILGELEDIDEENEIFVDVSDEDIESMKQGKTEDCKNLGEVKGDRNTGGIAGAMSIEYAKDPEDDIEKPDTFNFIYKTRAVIERCVNDGKITGKKDCIGGIVGFSEIGTVYKCENYGNAESTAGNYVGGIAGKSDSKIRKCYSKAEVSGDRYIGGIAGKAKEMSVCYSISDVSGDESIGSVIGKDDNRKMLNQNFFTDNGLGAVDGISYKGKAEPITYDELKNISGIPRRFISFEITFSADGKIVKTQEIKYGESTDIIEFPEIPQKEGNFGKWSEIKDKTVKRDIEVKCIYKPYITVLSSEEKSGELSVALAEGSFTDKAELHITKSKTPPPKKLIGNAEVFDIKLLNTDVGKNESVTVRVLGEKRSKATAYVWSDGRWQETEAETRGKYVILNVKGTENTVCLKYEKRGFGMAYIILPLILLGIILVVLKKTKKRKKPDA